ncbi:hypothetical protein HNP49_001485 [Pseudomonas fluvialis]|uniref:Nickel/cobalt transporter regulator n=1 Tax=Pseudomonas fluvialis TaxID=1793966 RepID=A0A7X0ERN3_9PSED|nr:anti-virulence regulator CigR family protein [Pseudomonas fluvialis]MBB6341328.1 hypothetical protein [Pseudomonas fluvialis]
MSLPRIFLLGASALVLSLSLQAAPNNDKGQGQGNKGQQHSQKQNGQGSSNKPAQYHDDGGKQSQNRQRDYRNDYDDDLSDIERILRGYQSPTPAKALPPGIAKNLARGKPLPPGIAKQIDPALARQLPYYPGYEWRQYGTDAVLVEVGTTVVREVLRDILR